MKPSLLFFLATLPLITLSAPIPQNWRNNPDFRYTYRLKQDYPRPWNAGPGHIFTPLRRGDVVTISARWFSDLTHRREERKLYLIKVTERDNDDGGHYHSWIPVANWQDKLERTEDRAPLTHWQKAYRRSADASLPDIRPNYEYYGTFPLVAFPAQRIEGERPRVLITGHIYRFVTPSPHCLRDEITIRVTPSSDSRYYQELARDNPEFVFVDSRHQTDYCLRFEDFIDEGTAKRPLNQEPADGIRWDVVAARYHSRFHGDVRDNENVTTVSPFSEADRRIGRSGPDIRIRPARDDEGHPEGASIARYGGPLYYACSGGICRTQGYRILVGRDGTLLRFLENRLYYYTGSDELLLEAVDIDRLVNFANDRAQLREVHLWARGDGRGSYATQMSRLRVRRPEGAGQAANTWTRPPGEAGNTFGTFLLHLSKIRSHLRADWPIYDGPAPGGAGE